VSELLDYAIVVLNVLLLAGDWAVAVHGLLRCLFLISLSVKKNRHLHVLGHVRCVPAS
jgi:hypothetical protein